ASSPTSCLTSFGAERRFVVLAPRALLVHQGVRLAVDVVEDQIRWGRAEFQGANAQIVGGSGCLGIHLFEERSRRPLALEEGTHARDRVALCPDLLLGAFAVLRRVIAGRVRTETVCLGFD